MIRVNLKSVVGAVGAVKVVGAKNEVHISAQTVNYFTCTTTCQMKRALPNADKYSRRPVAYVLLQMGTQPKVTDLDNSFSHACHKL